MKNWLLGLLPDNDRVLLALQHRHDIARSNRLDLLGTAIGEECAGAVQFCWRSRTEGLLNKEGGMTPISDDEVIAWLNELRDDPAYRPGDHEGRGGFSLAGMQPKIALRETSTGWAVPWGHEPTSHILKIARPQRFPHECVMEHITMGIANRLGISTASTELLVEDDLEAIVVKRYDRVSDNEGRLLRVHQEDFCQALGYPPDRKYQDEDGPTPTDIADMLQQTAPSPSNAETAVRRFRDMHIFQWLTVAIDAHSKNYSLLLSGDQTAVAAVVRHLLLVAVRGADSIHKLRLAMKFGRAYRIDSADRASAIRRTAANLKLPFLETAQRCEELAQLLPGAVRATIAALPAEFQNLRIVEHYATDQIGRAIHCQSIAAGATQKARSEQKTLPTRGSATM